MHPGLFEALADPTRRRIVEALRSGERQVGEIVEQAGIHQSGVSRHLRILHESGFVSVRPDGQRRFYALRPEPFRELSTRGSRATGGCGKRASTASAPRSRNDAATAAPRRRSDANE